MITIVAKSARTLHTNIYIAQIYEYTRGVAPNCGLYLRSKMSAAGNMDVHDNDKDESDEDHGDNEENHKLLSGSGKKMAFYKALTL